MRDTTTIHYSSCFFLTSIFDYLIQQNLLIALLDPLVVLFNGRGRTLRISTKKHKGPCGKAKEPSCTKPAELRFGICEGMLGRMIMTKSTCAPIPVEKGLELRQWYLDAVHCANPCLALCVSNRLQSQRHTERASVKSKKRIYDSNDMTRSLEWDRRLLENFGEIQLAMTHK